MQTILPSKDSIEIKGITFIDNIYHIEIPDVYIIPQYEFKVYYGNDYKILSYDSYEKAEMDRNHILILVRGLL